MAALWGYLWEQWAVTTEQAAREAKEKLGPRERALVQGFAQEVSEVLQELQALEERIEKGAPNPPAFRDVFKSILSKLYTVATTGPALAGQVPVTLLNRIWSNALQAFTAFLERKASDLDVDSWSIGASFGFPSGVTGTLTVTFRSKYYTK